MGIYIFSTEILFKYLIEDEKTQTLQTTLEKTLFENAP